MREMVRRDREAERPPSKAEKALALKLARRVLRLCPSAQTMVRLMLAGFPPTPRSPGSGGR